MSILVTRGELRLLERVLAVRPHTDGAEVPLTYEMSRGGPGTDNPVGTPDAPVFDPGDPAAATGFGPISPFWPARMRWLGPVDRLRLQEPIPALPDATPWEYFQVAPRAQQIPALRGGERLVLRGVHRDLAQIETELARDEVAARVLSTDAAGLPVGTPRAVALSCDALAIDADALTIDLVWRGCVELADEAELRRAHVHAVSVSPGGAPDWSRLASVARPAAVVTRHTAIEVAGGDDDTVAVTTDGEAVGVGRALPFFGSAASSPPTTAATPWSRAPLAAAPPAVEGDSTLLVGGTGSAGRDATYALSPGEQMASAMRPVAPYPIGAPAPAAGGARPPWVDAAIAAVPPPAVAGDATMAAGPAEPPAVEPEARVPRPDAQTATPAAPLASALRDMGVASDDVAALLAAVSAPRT